MPVRLGLLQPYHHGFGLGVEFQRFVPHLTAPAGLLVATEGERRVEHVVAWIHTVPAFSSAATRWALAMSRVQTPAAKPYSVWFARGINSSGLLKGSATTTGPKISSRTMLIPGFTSLTTVGWTK